QSLEDADPFSSSILGDVGIVMDYWDTGIPEGLIWGNISRDNFEASMEATDFKQGTGADWFEAALRYADFVGYITDFD
ncbi:hypothetical protein, partial [Rhodovulum sulfidophilum]